MLLSPHFALAEMVRSAATERLNIDNTPNETVIENLRALCTVVLEPMRRHFGRPVAITSGYRCHAVNAAVGGAATSRHLTGEAVDFEVPGVPNPVVARWLAAAGIPFDELILEFWRPGVPASGWVHVAHRRAPRKNAYEVLTVARVGCDVVTSTGLPRE